MVFPARSDQLPQPPAPPSLVAIGLVAAAFLFVLASARFGAVGVLAFYGASACLLISRFNQFRLRLTDIPIAAFEVFLLLSSIWSIYPDVTFRAALQSASTVACAWIIVRCTNGVEWPAGLVIGVGLILAIAVAQGDLRLDEGSERLALGFLGSKNQLGWAAAATFMASTVLLGRRDLWILAGPLALFSGAVLALSTSAGAIVMTAGAMLGLAIIWLVLRLELQLRIVVLSVFFALAALILALFIDDILGIVLDATNRDRTLTGRTDLWDYGLTIWRERPLLGHGFFAFWTQGNPDAEILWAEFLIPGRSGFHFHNLYVEYLVAIGVVGTGLLICLQLCFLVATTISVGAAQVNLERTIAIGMGMMLLIRSFFEVELFGPFNISTIIFVLCFSIVVGGDGWRQRDHT